jgi:hypothetical protein
MIRCRSFHGAVKDREFTDAEVDRLARYQMATIEKVSMDRLVGSFCLILIQEPREAWTHTSLAVRVVVGARTTCNSGTPRAALPALRISLVPSVPLNIRRRISLAEFAPGQLPLGCRSPQQYSTGTACSISGEAIILPLAIWLLCAPAGIANGLCHWRVACTRLTSA